MKYIHKRPHPSKLVASLWTGTRLRSNTRVSHAPMQAVVRASMSAAGYPQWMLRLCLQSRQLLRQRPQQSGRTGFPPLYKAAQASHQQPPREELGC